MNSFKRLVELIEDWHFLIRRKGLKSAIPIVALDIAGLPYRHLKFLILACSLNDPLPNYQPKLPLKIRPFTETDLKLIREINRPSEVRLCALRLMRKQYGLIAMNNFHAVGYAWGYTEIASQLERVPIRLENGDILCNDSFTAPAYRGQGVQTALTLARLHLFQELGLRRALCYIENCNTPSIAVWKRKLNSTIIGQIDFKRIGPWHRVKFSDYQF